MSLLVIVQMLIAAVVSSGVIAFIFQRKLRRLQSYETTTKHLMKRLIEGIDDVYASTQHMATILDDLVAQLPLRPQGLKALDDIFQRWAIASRTFSKRLSCHRIYIVSLVPFGESSKYSDCFYAISNYLETLHSLPENPQKDDDRSRAIQDSLSNEIQRARQLHTILQQRILEIRTRIMNGEPA